MALTGLGLILFLFAHLAGNLLIFAGADALNDYAALLKSNMGVLWGARVGLIVIFILHVSTAFQLSRENTLARPTAYAHQNTVQATLSSRSMALSGTFVLFYVVGHLLHFTMGVILPEHYAMTDSMGRHDVYSMVVLGFQNVAVSLAYIAAMIFVGSHLSHAIASSFQTIGFNHPNYTPVIQKIGPAVAAILTLGYISIPAAVLAGLITT